MYAVIDMHEVQPLEVQAGASPPRQSHRSVTDASGAWPLTKSTCERTVGDFGVLNFWFRLESKAASEGERGGAGCKVPITAVRVCEVGQSDVSGTRVVCDGR